MKILIDGMRGLGDNIYISAFVRNLALDHEIHISTPWPELLSDVPSVKFHKCHTNLRTQAKNIAKMPPSIWSHGQGFDKTINVQYAAGSNIPNDLQRIFGCKPAWGLPSFKGPKINKPYILVRPATLRKEWFASSRNPHPEYINNIVGWLSEKYTIVSVADLDGDNEYLVGDAPFADIRYHKGELSMAEMMGLAQGAAGIVGGVGWIVPFAIASRVPAFVIMGGNGEYNAPEKLTNATMDLSKIKFAMPDKFCRCKDMKHNCDKTNSNLKGQFDEWKSIL